MRWLRARERALFRTHQPEFRSPEWVVGQTVHHEGGLYRVTRWVELPPVPLDRGGSVGEWEVWGRRLSDREMRKELLDATDRILGP
ncbi:MAG: hypothetical protein A2133_04365 [Actinobacteria bacterium RBG_16_64_13]|nr:MAG: hypothetical protein A2133_04365 [Actinobacteria bacterium RBG_16_64_13]